VGHALSAADTAVKGGVSQCCELLLLCCGVVCCAVMWCGVLCVSYCVDEGQDLLCVFEQEVVVDLGGEAQQVTQGEVLVNGPLDSPELVKNQLIGDVAGAWRGGGGMY